MKLLGVLGNPIEHSRSPEIHDAFANISRIDIEYRRVLVDKGKFEDVARAFLSEGAHGFNITVPNKQDAYEFADELSHDARRSGAVNTIQRMPDNRVVGHNTDGAGLVADITLNLNWTLKEKKILIIGAGGAVKGVLGNLLETDPIGIDVVNRTHQKAVDIVEWINDGRLEAKHFDELDSGYDIIISGSSAGLKSNSLAPALPDQIVNEESRCYDMIYGSRLTPFLTWCRARNCREYSDGLGMLVEQAALAFNIWFERQVETGDVIRRLRGLL